MADCNLERDSEHTTQLARHLVAAARDHDLPEGVIEQLEAAVATAVRESFEYDDRVASVTVSVQCAPAKADQALPGWGFFLVRKCSSPAHTLVEVHLYPD